MTLELIETKPLTEQITNARNIVNLLGNSLNDKIKQVKGDTRFNDEIVSLNGAYASINGVDEERQKLSVIINVKMVDYTDAISGKPTNIDLLDAMKRVSKLIFEINDATENYNAKSQRIVEKLEKIITDAKVLIANIDAFLVECNSIKNCKEEIIKAMCNMTNVSGNYVYDIIDCKLTKTLAYNTIPLTTNLTPPKQLNISTTKKIKSWDLVNYIKNKR